MLENGRSRSAGYDRTDLALRGALAGLLGAIVMGMVGMAVAALKGPGFGVPMSVIAAHTIGRGAGSELIVLGSVLHMLVGAAFGSLFAVTMPKSARIASMLGFGVVYGLVLHLFMFYVVLRPLEAVQRTPRVDTWWFLTEHLIYGLTVALVMSAWFSALRSDRTARPA